MLRALCILLMSGCVAVAFGQGKKRRQKEPLILVEINGRKIPSDEFVYLYNKNHQSKPNEYSASDINEYLDLFVKFKLKVEEARQRGMDTTSAFLTEYNSYRNELIKPYLPDNAIMDSLVVQAYDRMKQEIRASHLLISVKNDATPADTLKAYNRALELKERIYKGEDLGRLAAEFSGDPSAKTNHGDLGFFTALQMVYPFETAAYDTPVGQLAGPVRTQFGYHIIKVTDRQPARGEVEVSHIMLRTGSDKDENEIRNKIFSVYDQLTAGASWDELCRQYSEDANSTDQNGRLRAFGVGAMASVPEFEKVAFSLRPGDISDPFRTDFGWHVLRVEKKILLPAFEELKPQLKNRIAGDGRFAKSRSLWIEKLKEEYEFREVQEIKDRLLGLADSVVVKGTWKPGALAPIASQTVFSLNGVSYPVTEFGNYVRKQRLPVSEKPREVLKRLYDHYVEEKLLDLAGRKIVRDFPEFSMLANEYYEGILLFDIMEKEVWNRAAADTAGQVNYFMQNRSRYVAGERANATFYSSPDSMILGPLIRYAQEGDTAAVENYTEGKGIKRESGIFERDDRPILKAIDWSPGPHSAENSGMYYLAWIHQILPPGEKSLEEARASLITDYQQALEAAWIRQLQEKYPVKINEKARHYVLDQLQKR
ncbi:MAG TPA: peptidylprolyl isomerase [Cyclobacteriaceae bacterium]